MRKIWIDNFKSIGCVMVLMLHLLAPITWESPKYDFEWGLMMIIDLVGRTFVVGFFIISGYLYNNKHSARKKGFELITLYLVMSLFYYIWKIIRPEAFVNIMIVGQSHSIQYFILDLFLGSSFYHLWFLLVLGLIFVFYNQLYKLFKNITLTKLISFYTILFIVEYIVSTNKEMLLMLDAILHLPLLSFIFYAPIFIYGTKIKKLEKIKTTTTKSSVAYGVLLLLNIFALFLINILFGFGYLNTGELRSLLLLLCSYFNPLVVYCGCLLVNIFMKTNMKSFIVLLSVHSRCVYLMHPLLFDLIVILS